MYLILGGDGFLGTYIIKNILLSTDEKIFATTRMVTGNEYESKNRRVCWEKCDITDFNHVETLRGKLADNLKEMKIIFLAAYHHPDEVVKHWDIAWHVNITCLAYFLNCFRECKCLYYSSTDSVYGESIDGYAFSEEDLRRPVNPYGKQKCIAEDLVTGYGQHVARFPFLIAPSLVKGRKHFYDVIVDELNAGREMEMFSDSYRSSLHFNDAARILIELIEKHFNELPEVINICANKPLSKYEVGIMIANKLGVDTNLVKPMCVEDGSNVFKSKRAKSSIMDNSRLRQLIGKDVSLKL